MKGLKLVNRLGRNNVLIRMDNITVVQALKQDEGYSMVAALILEDCRRDLSEFGKACVEFCNRESNVVAHVLTKLRTSPRFGLIRPWILLLSS